MTDERSTSRGRNTFIVRFSLDYFLIHIFNVLIQQSTGRGGIGNMRATSLSRDARPDSGPDDFSVTRGREPAVNPNQVRAFIWVISPYSNI